MPKSPEVTRRGSTILLGGAFAATLRSNGALADDVPAPAPISAEEGARIAREAAWTEFRPGQRVWGYVDRHSIAAGETLNIMLSTRPGSPVAVGKVEVSRLGEKDGRPVRERAVTSASMTVEAQTLTNTSAVVGAGWYIGSVIDETSRWRTGVYVVDFLGDDQTSDFDLAFFVVTPSRKRGDILVKICANTHQAYNAWGGGSLYGSAIFGDVAHKPSMVAFDRPTYPAFLEYEGYFVAWVEAYARETRRDVAYISDFDLHADPRIADGYKLLVSQGHDEYWTKEMYDAVERRVFELGRNTLFLGANTAYWQVRYADLYQAPGGPNLGRQMVSFKEAEDPIVNRFVERDMALPWMTTQFRWRNRRPETMLIGVAYQSYFDSENNALRYDYVVNDAASPLFAGTGLTKGDAIKGVLGYEWDNRDPDGDGNRLLAAGLAKNARIPLDGMKVLFTGETVDIDGKKGLAEAVFWKSPAGAKVFAAGSIRWSWGLGHPDHASKPFQRFNHNLFDEMLK